MVFLPSCAKARNVRVNCGFFLSGTLVADIYGGVNLVPYDVEKQVVVIRSV